MKALNNNEFENYLNEVYEEALSYESRFSREYYEIGFLVSRTACGLLARYSGEHLCLVGTDSFNGNSYLFGHRIAFVNSNYIPSFTEETFLIKPFVVCNHVNHFPMEAETGDYIFYNGWLKQATYIDMIDGSRAIGITDINVSLSDNYIMSDVDRAQTYNGILREINDRNQRRDKWVESVDTTAIKEYLSSITIT